MKLADFKGEAAFKVMGEVVSTLRVMFQDEKVLKIVTEQKQGYLLEFFEYSLKEQSKQWLDLFTALNPDKDREEVNPMDVVAFALEFRNDEQLMSLFFSSGRTMAMTTSIGSATENTEV
jgi:hypothetical protein